MSVAIFNSFVYVHQRVIGIPICQPLYLMRWDRGPYFSWLMFACCLSRGKVINRQETIGNIFNGRYNQLHCDTGYPLVNIPEAIENGHRNSGFSHEKWVDLSIAMLVHQRV